MKLHALRLEPGDDLKKSIASVAIDQGVAAGVVLSAVGSLDRVRVRLAGADHFLEDLGVFEILSVQGTVGSDGVHLHLAFSGPDGVAMGGHLSDGCSIRTTCELVLLEDQGITFSRRHDDVTGFHELFVTDAEPTAPSSRSTRP